MYKYQVSPKSKLFVFIKSLKSAEKSTLCQIFIGRIPKDLYEDELVTYFSKLGRIDSLCLMMDAASSTNRYHAMVSLRTLQLLFTYNFTLLQQWFHCEF